MAGVSTLAKSKTGRTVAETVAQTVAGGEVDYALDVEVLRGVAELVSALEEIRESASMSRAEVARRISAQRTAIARLLDGDNANPTTKTLIKLFWSLGLHAEVTIRERRPADDHVLDVVNAFEPSPSRDAPHT